MTLQIWDFLPARSDYDRGSFPFVSRTEENVDFTKNPYEVFDKKVSTLLVVKSPKTSYGKETLNQHGYWKRVEMGKFTGREVFKSTGSKTYFVFQNNVETEDKTNWVMEEYQFLLKEPALCKIQLMNATELRLFFRMEFRANPYQKPLDLQQKDRSYLQMVAEFEKNGPNESSTVKHNLYEIDPQSLVVDLDLETLKSGICIFANQGQIDSRKSNCDVGFWRILHRYGFIKSETGTDLGFKRILEFCGVAEDVTEQKWVIEEYRIDGNAMARSSVLCVLKRMSSSSFNLFFDREFGPLPSVKALPWLTGIVKA